MELTSADAGGRRTARLGEDIVVALPENPTTGYRWSVEVDPAALNLIDDQYEGPTTPRGAAGTRRLTFSPRKSGAVHLRLVKKRAWEKEGVERFETDVDIEG